MSFRGQRSTADEMLGRHDARLREHPAGHGEGPRSFGAEAYLARGPAIDPAETDDTYSDEPSGDPYFHILTVSGVLEPTRRYLIHGLIVVSPIAAASVSANYRVRIATDCSVAGEEVGAGVSDHTLFAEWPHWFTNVAAVERADPYRYWTPDEEDLYEFSLIVEAGLEPTGAQPSTLHILDVGRSTAPDPDSA